jgi:hypothetical protein
MRETLPTLIDKWVSHRSSSVLVTPKFKLSTFENPISKYSWVHTQWEWMAITHEDSWERSAAVALCTSQYTFPLATSGFHEAIAPTDKQVMYTMYHTSLCTSWSSPHAVWTQFLWWDLSRVLTISRTIPRWSVMDEELCWTTELSNHRWVPSLD